MKKEIINEYFGFYDTIEGSMKEEYPNGKIIYYWMVKDGGMINPDESNRSKLDPKYKQLYNNYNQRLIELHEIYPLYGNDNQYSIIEQLIDSKDEDNLIIAIEMVKSKLNENKVGS